MNVEFYIMIADVVKMMADFSPYSINAVNFINSFCKGEQFTFLSILFL